MTQLALQQLIGTALVDRDLCDGLMNGRRSAVLADYDLTDEERDVLASLDAASVHELASSVHGWLKERGEAVARRDGGDAVGGG